MNHRISAFFIAFVALVCVSWTVLRTKQRAPTFNIEGTVLLLRDYCGGAAPSEDQLNPKPYPEPNVKLYIHRSATNTSKKVILDSVISDANGKFSVKLKPGTYCFIKIEKKAPYVTPLNTQYVTHDPECARIEYARCDFSLTVKDAQDSVQIILPQHCFWKISCQSYSGPLPPSTPPVNRSGNQPGHQE